MTTPPGLTHPHRPNEATARLLGSPVRLDIVQHLQHHGPQTARELAERSSAGLTRNAINRHINSMLDDGWIVITATHQGRGLPERTVGLAHEFDWIGLIAELNRRSSEAGS